MLRQTEHNILKTNRGNKRQVNLLVLCLD